jgi:DNA-directed RNA polymerase specialized sigma24 family protein
MTRPSTHPPSAGSDTRMALTLEAVVRRYGRVWLRYAHLQTGSRSSGEKIVRDTIRQLVGTWEHVLRQPSVTDHAWLVLKSGVNRWLESRDQEASMPGTAAFAVGARKVFLFETQAGFAVLDSALGLYAAISELPERQFDVIVLRYVLNQEIQYIADFLGISPETVSTNINAAKKKLARKLPGLVRTGEDDDQ